MAIRHHRTSPEGEGHRCKKCGDRDGMLHGKILQ
jgi:hypothetical protein